MCFQLGLLPTVASGTKIKNERLTHSPHEISVGKLTRETPWGAKGCGLRPSKVIFPVCDNLQKLISSITAKSSVLLTDLKAGRCSSTVYG
ncbi:hypothetical protein YC2023_018227 [Brassica napus]